MEMILSLAGQWELKQTVSCPTESLQKPGSFCNSPKSGILIQICRNCSHFIPFFLTQIFHGKINPCQAKKCLFLSFLSDSKIESWQIWTPTSRNLCLIIKYTKLRWVRRAGKLWEVTCFKLSRGKTTTIDKIFHFPLFSSLFEETS